ncbi:hypothetical protein SEPCBS119000_006319 [Sporothrix epigloea]|uniref:Uncharacterized protein n=1 Tax=Sporothrix epigloea TaxID=1892477 RepID=A0ABP0E3N6_9PEZI
MSSSASRGGAERAVHQDFIARIRYSNKLPPPPNPPKLLEIPNTGLGSGYYTSPAFASRLAREQPLNIEVDAELGMPLDLIGMPGIFDGDESSIQAAANPPPIHPHDRALLKPLSSLGKPRASDAAVSFLRRTEYISSVASKGGPAARRPFRTDINKTRRPEKRSSPEPDAGTPAYVKRKIEQSFTAAQAAARDRYSRVRHPTKKNLRLAAAYPLIPDLGAFPDSGAYVTMKFSNNPVVAGSGIYDSRLLSGIFKPVEMSEEERLAFEVATKAYERDPRRNVRPQNRMRYEFYLPDKTSSADAFRRTFNETKRSEKTEDGDEAEKERFSFNRVRVYESIEEKEFTHATKYAEEILLAFTEDAGRAAPDMVQGTADSSRAALYYPVMQRTVVRSQRQKQIARLGHEMDDENGDGSERPVDRMLVAVQDPPEDMKEHIARIRADPLHFQDNELDVGIDEEEASPAAAQRSNGQRRAASDDEDERVGDDDAGSDEEY